MLEDRGIARTRINRVLWQLVRPAVYGARVPLSVAAHHVHGEPIGVAEARAREYRPFAVGDAWGGAWDTTWFRMQATVPSAWQGEEVVALVDLGGMLMVGFTAEGLVWEGDQPRQGLHLKHREYVVARPAAGGESVDLLVEAAANPVPPWGGLEWPLLMPDFDGPPIYRLGQADLVVARRDVEALFFDMLVLTQLLDVLPSDEPRFHHVFRALVAACDAIELEDVPASAAAARRALAPALASPAVPSAHRVSAIGNAHIDTAWLWPVRETKRKCARTFSNALRLMEDYPEYRFSASQAQQYTWMKEHYPPLYERMKEKVKAGQFEPVGSMWVEADCNIPSGESLVRQIVHGKRFFLDEFDRETTDLWLPDVFGYSAALPQILHEAGISSFLTQKMSWSEINKFPHHTFWWEGIDGTRLLTHFPPADTYGGEMTVAELVKGVHQFSEHGRSAWSLYPFGYGDGGGGPTRSMLESARRLADLEGAPRVQLDTVASFWEKVRAESSDLPVWVGELYLERHRATYTTNGPIKRANRRNEEALRAAELWSTAAFAISGWDHYPTEELDRAWKLLLLNQFHDIIPGSSIRWANEDSLADHASIAALTSEVIARAQQAIVDGIDTGSMARPVVVFNPASRDREELVEIDAAGGTELVTVAVPACGYSLVDLAAPTPVAPSAPAVSVSDRSLENELLRVAWDDDGLLTSVYDKEAEREVLAPGARGNVFQLHEDLPNDLDSWDVDLHYFHQRVDLTEVASIAVVEARPERAAVQLVRRFGGSEIRQTMRLARGSKRLDFETEVDWHERHRFLKVAFPLAIHASRATYEIQFGHLERPTHTNTTWDLARFEVCAHRWADLGEAGYGVALLNDCKYGYDVHGNVMRLSLLRGPGWPDREADQRTHRFSYALLPHIGDLREAGVVAEAEAFNLPLVVVPAPAGRAGASSRRASGSIVRVDRPNVTIEAVKKADRGDALIVRVCEVFGARGRVRVRTALPLRGAMRVDVLERDLEPLGWNDGGVTLDVRPFELVTLRLDLA